MLRHVLILGIPGLLCACGGDIAASATDVGTDTSSGTPVGPSTDDAPPTSSQAAVTDSIGSDSGTQTSDVTSTGGAETTGEIETRECLSQVCTVPNSHESIQAAVDDVGCDVVNVCPGIYYENVEIHRSLTLKRAPVLGDDPVVIDGAGKDRVIKVFDNLLEGGVYFDVVLKRLTLQNGDSSNAAGEEKGGGGLQAWGHLVVDSCVIQNNKAVSEGGGVWIWGSAQIVDTKILGNTVVDPKPEEEDFPFVRVQGGGAWLLSHSEIIDSVIAQNSVIGARYQEILEGGGLAAYGESISIVGTEIVDNHIILQQDPNLDIFAGTTQIDGGGGGLITDVHSLKIESSRIDGNTAEIEVDEPNHSLFFHLAGGGLYVHGGKSLDVKDTSFNNNKVVVTGAWRGTGISDQDWTVQEVGGGGIAFWIGFLPMGANFTDVAVRGNEVAVAASIAQNDPDPAKSGILWARGGGVSLQEIYTCPENVTFVRADISENRVTMTQEGVEDAMLFLGQGGGVFGCAGPSKDSLHLRETTLAENSVEISNSPGWAQLSSGEGGGLFVAQRHLNAAGWMRVSQSTLRGNTIHSSGNARGAGAAVSSLRLSCEDVDQHATVAFENTTFHQNSAEMGASSSQGGGLWLYAKLPSPSKDCAPAVPEHFWQQIELSNVTVTENAAREGGGVHVVGVAAGNHSKASIRNSIVYGNQALTGPDCFAGDQLLTSFDYNIFQSLSQCNITGQVAHNLVGQDPELTPLAGNGGPTQTQAVPLDSIAAALGRPGDCLDHEGMVLAVDQRGYQRPVGGRCDIGAYEAGAKPW